MGHPKEDVKGEMYGDEVRRKIEAFADQGWESIPEDERDEWFTRFKFWGVFHQRGGQESYFMLRLTNCGGVLEPGQLRAIGDVARDYATGPVANPEFGDAWIDLTTRQSIQIHWLDLGDIPEIWERLEAVGVSSRSAGGDTMRNISGCPVAGKAEEFVETRPLLEEIQAEIRGDDDLCNMPRKFNISVFPRYVHASNSASTTSTFSENYAIIQIIFSPISVVRPLFPLYLANRKLQVLCMAIPSGRDVIWNTIMECTGRIVHDSPYSSSIVEVIGTC